MSISQRTLDRIRELVTLTDYFSDRGVHKEGSRHVCNCPFHENDGKSRTLALYPLPDGRFNCFRCKVHGDIFDAVILKEGVEWTEAVERLAKRAGIEIERSGRDASDAAACERARRGAAYAVAEWATVWMHDQLLHAPAALGYLLVDRKLPQEVINRWRVGWASGEQLIPAAIAAGHTMDALKDAGLVVERDEGRNRAFFYERITIPITNANNRVIAWTARALPDAMKEASQAGRFLSKYINPTDTLIYAKRRALLGLRQAHAHLARHQALAVVEGALDVLGLDALGVPIGCCTCGTALSVEQAGALIDISTHAEVPIVTLYDGDGAGRDATQRNAELLFRLGGRAKVGLLPSEVADPHSGTTKVKDACDIWQHAGTAGGPLIAAAIAGATPAWNYLVERAAPAPGAMDIDARLIAADKLLVVINQIEDDERRDMALAQAAERLDLTRAQLARRSDRQRDVLARQTGASGQRDPIAAGNAPEGAWGFRIPPANTEALQPPGRESDFELNELGNALRFAAHYGSRVRYVATWGSWLVWNGTHWSIDNTSQAQRWMLEAIDSSCRAEISRAWDKARAAPKNSRDATEWQGRALDLESWRVKNLCSRSKGNSLDVATALRCLVCTSEQLDADPFLFACKNGWVDLRTGILSPHDAAKLYTRSCPIEFDPHARDQRWERFIDESIGGNAAVLGFLRRYAGYSATGDTGEQAVLMVAGPGGNGKSLYTRCLQLILGGYSYSADFAIFLAAHGDKRKWTLANLEKARLVVCEESGEGRRFSSDLVKNVTGGTPIEAEAKGRQPFTYVPQFKVLFVTNHPPRVSDRDDAFWRRMKLVRFDFVPAKRDKNLASHLLSTRSAQQAILAWVIAGAQEWHRDGLQTPAEIENANLLYRDEQNPIRDWLAERTVWADTLRAIDPAHAHDDLAVAKAVLRLDYLNWCKDNGTEPISSNQFSGRLRDLGATEDGSAFNPDRDRHERAWLGLRLRVPAIDDQPRRVALLGGPLAYISATDRSQLHLVLDSSPAESPTTSAAADNSDGPESRNTRSCSPSVSAQPDDGTGANTTTLSPLHPRAPARDTQTRIDYDDPEGNPAAIRARKDPFCSSVSKEEKGSPTGDDQQPPPPGSRAAKLRQPPGPGEDLFADPPPEGHLPREPGADEGEPWPPSDEPEPQP